MVIATGRVRSPKTEKEEIALLPETGTKNTKYKTKWAGNAFTAWQNKRVNKRVQLETDGEKGLESTDLEDLSVSLEHMSAKSFWRYKFICEVAKQSGKQYPPKTLYLLVCGIKRHLYQEMFKGKWRSTYWRKVTEGKTTFLEVIFHHICVYLYVSFFYQYVVCILKAYDVSKNARWGN